MGGEEGDRNLFRIVIVELNFSCENYAQSIVDGDGNVLGVNINLTDLGNQMQLWRETGNLEKKENEARDRSTLFDCSSTARSPRTMNIFQRIMGNTSSTASPSPRTSNDRTAANGSSSLSNTLSGAANNLSSRITGGGSSNNATSLHIPSIASFSPFRGTGSLGLTKAELDLACQPSGLYPSCEWDAKQIRRLIGDGRLAPRLKGSDSRCTKSDRECPICFMLYSQSNVTKCW